VRSGGRERDIDSELKALPRNALGSQDDRDPSRESTDRKRAVGDRAGARPRNGLEGGDHVGEAGGRRHVGERILDRLRQ
jgi:hypothetical protein